MITTIHFPGTCDEAILFYQKALGADVKEVAYARNAPPETGLSDSLPPNFVMHSELIIFGTTVNMTDGAESHVTSSNFSFLIRFESAKEIKSVFNKLADGGKIIEALAPQFWASLYGFVEDRFGVGWQFMTKD